ncbi:hypothetical protein ZWY2020_026630 [Hordeum vulgare]|nr:hypothetical protein ZWY2020_026630 [Hordeum vulgare]
MTSRHRRQPSRALPVDFDAVDVGDEPVGGATSKGAASTRGPGAGGRSDGAKAAGQEGPAKKLPPAAGGGRSPTAEGAGKGPCDGGNSSA